MCVSVCECVCVFLQELLHFGYCKVAILFWINFSFFFLFSFLGIFFFFSLVFNFSFFFCFLLSALLVNVILFYFGIFFLLSILFSFPSFFSSIVSLRDEIAGEGDFFHSCKGVQRVSVCPLGKRIKNKKKQVRLFWWQQFWAFFQPFCVSFKETVIGACLLALLCFASASELLSSWEGYREAGILQISNRNKCKIGSGIDSWFLKKRI